MVVPRALEARDYTQSVWFAGSIPVSQTLQACASVGTGLVSKANAQARGFDSSHACSRS